MISPTPLIFTRPLFHTISPLLFTLFHSLFFFSLSPFTDSTFYPTTLLHSPTSCSICLSLTIHMWRIFLLILAVESSPSYWKHPMSIDECRASNPGTGLDVVSNQHFYKRHWIPHALRFGENKWTSLLYRIEKGVLSYDWGYIASQPWKKSKSRHPKLFEINDVLGFCSSCRELQWSCRELSIIC